MLTKMDQYGQISKNEFYSSFYTQIKIVLKNFFNLKEQLKITRKKLNA
jgi:hypothetical protein